MQGLVLLVWQANFSMCRRGALRGSTDDLSSSSSSSSNTARGLWRGVMQGLMLLVWQASFSTRCRDALRSFKLQGCYPCLLPEQATLIGCQQDDAVLQTPDCLRFMYYHVLHFLWCCTDKVAAAAAAAAAADNAAYFLVSAQRQFVRRICC
jgi:hypothetical protein